MNISNKHILITGGNRGIGLALAKEFNKRGGYLHITMRSSLPGQERDEFLKGFKHPEKLEMHELDLIDKANIVKFYENFTSQGKQIDILVNNAGLLTGGLIEEQPIDDIYNMFQVNLTAPIHLTQLFLPGMVKRDSGLIINNCSVSAVGHLPCASTYAASKSGLMAFTNSLISELNGTNVNTLTLITPGIKTRMYDEIPNLYGGHLDLDILSSISPEDYAIEVCNAVESNKEFYWPKEFSMKVAMWIAQHSPALYRKMVAPKFKR